MATYYERLERETADARKKFMDLPLPKEILGGAFNATENSLPLQPIYRQYLKESYHHVRVASRTYALAGSRMREEDEAVHQWLIKHAADENGHHLWILSDLKSLGMDTMELISSKPSPNCDALIAYMYYTAGYENPMGILGDSYVIEGLSQLFATRVAKSMKQALGLTDKAVEYLAHHGELDESHMLELADLIDRSVLKAEDLQAIIHCANVEFELYGRMVQGCADAALREASSVLGCSRA